MAAVVPAVDEGFGGGDEVLHCGEGAAADGLAGDDPEEDLADIVNLIWSNGRIIEATSATAPNAWRRYLYLMLDAYRAERAHPIPEPPMTYEQLYDAMVHLSEAE